MKLLTFAIASIVDANTGHGLARPKHGAGYGTEIRRTRPFRSSFVIGALRAAGESVAGLVDRYRRRLGQARELKQLMALDDHQLRDIGLGRGDLIAVQLGVISHDELYLRWTAGRRHDPEFGGRAEAVTTALRVDHDAANEANFEPARCA